MPKRKPYKKKLRLFITVVLFVLLIAIISMSYLSVVGRNNSSQVMKQSNAVQTTNTQSDLIFASEEPDSITKSVYNYFKNKFEATQPTKGNLWWISDEGWNIIDNNAVAINIYFKLPSGTTCQAYNAPQVQPCSKVPQVMEVNKILGDAFISSGFTKNELNSSKSLDDVNFYDYIIAFQKNNTKCLLVTNGDGGTGDHTGDAVLTVECSNNFQKAYQDELPYLKALANYNNNLKDAAINEESIHKYGDFVTVGHHFRRTGLEAVMIKAGDGYKVLFLYGQRFDKNQCSILRQYDAPQELLKDCN